jgi:hypothetical protein
MNFHTMLQQCKPHDKVKAVVFIDYKQYIVTFMVDNIYPLNDNIFIETSTFLPAFNVISFCTTSLGYFAYQRRAGFLYNQKPFMMYPYVDGVNAVGHYNHAQDRLLNAIQSHNRTIKKLESRLLKNRIAAMQDILSKCRL